MDDIVETVEKKEVIIENCTPVLKRLHIEKKAGKGA